MTERQPLSFTPDIAVQNTECGGLGTAALPRLFAAPRSRHPVGMLGHVPGSGTWPPFDGPLPGQEPRDAA